jgi:hypothetical protein
MLSHMQASRQPPTHTHTPIVTCNHIDTPTYKHKYLKSSKIVSSAFITTGMVTHITGYSIYAVFNSFLFADCAIHWRAVSAHRCWSGHTG